MKKLLTFLLLGGSLYAQDLYLDIKLVGPKTIEIHNKNYTQMGLDYKADGLQALIPELRNSFGQIEVPIGKTTVTYTGNPPSIRMKATAVGIWLGEMPTWVEIPADLISKQVSFKSMEVKRIDSANVKVIFKVEDQINVRQYNIQLSPDNKNWKTYQVLFPNNLTANTTYSVTVKL